MFALLQWVGGIGYLTQKILLFSAEGDDSPRGLRLSIIGWISYLIGLLPWVIIFAHEHNWIAASVELGGAPSMVLGIVVATRLLQKTNISDVNIKAPLEPPWLVWFARLAVVVGLGVSLYDFGGIVTIRQVLELGIATGFLLGTYLLAKKNPTGWLWYMLMNISNAVLMGIQDYYVLSAQQALSLVFVVAGYLKSRRVKQ